VNLAFACISAVLTILRLLFNLKIDPLGLD